MQINVNELFKEINVSCLSLLCVFRKNKKYCEIFCRDVIQTQRFTLGPFLGSHGAIMHVVRYNANISNMYIHIVCT